MKSNLLIIIPIISSMLSVYLCDMKNAGSNIKFRPPSYVFSIVWSCLYLFIGIAWYKSIEDKHLKDVYIHTIYLCIIISLFIWVYIYSCKNKKKEASWIFICILTFILISLIYGNIISRLLMCPLFAWCIYATIMNTTEVQSL